LADAFRYSDRGYRARVTTKELQRVRELFDAAMDQPPELRPQFLESACGKDPALLDAVLRLLRANERAGVLDTPLRERSEAERQAPVPDSTLGPYRVLEQLSSGGMGVVYQAVRDDQVFRRICAIKVIRPELCSEWLLERFREERQILARLDHINIARIVDGGTTPEGLPYFVMDYVDGPPIDKFCRQHQLSERQRLALVLQACSAVEYIHLNGVIHGDLKPSNILVGYDGVVKLVDFGIASALSVPDERGGHQLQLLMTPSYASPEQQRGERLTAASDIYSLGVILFELLTGKRLFAPARTSSGSGGDAWAPPPSVDESGRPAGETGRVSALNYDLRCITSRAIEDDPKKRYPSTAALKDDIARYRDGRAISVHPGLLYRGRKFLVRNRSAVLAWLAIAILLPITAWACIVAHQRKQKADALEKQVLQLQTLMVERSREYRQNLSSPSQAGTTRSERPEVEQRQLRDLDLLAHAYRTEFTDSVRIWPGLTRNRRELLDQTSSYLERAETLASRSEAGRTELAEAWLWVANLEGNPQKVNLHDHAGALASIHEAERLVHSVPGGPAAGLARQVSDAEQEIESGGRR
jgi:serine/threonine protein kinase